MSADRYTFEREIGRGASGPVWSGRDTVLGRTVALKRVGVHAGGTDAALQQGAREARLAASLNHPHVVGVFDLVVVGDEHWLVMEHVDGQSLAELVREQGPLEPQEAARVLAQVAEALAAAHRAGIVHRDVKPSNILLTRDGTAKLTDFGIARSADDTSLTQTGLVTGSPAYLPPEVATGSSATPASDVWALGATLFHLLAGRPPYHVGDNVLSTMYRIVHEEPPRLPETGRLNTVLERTMAIDPEARWTMGQVRDALRHLSEEAPARPRRTGATSAATAAATTPPAAVDTAPGRSDDDTRTTASIPAGRMTSALPPAQSVSPPPGRRRPWLVWARVAAGILLSTVVALYAGLNAARDPAPTAGQETPSPTTTSPEPTASPTAVTEAEMTSFVTDYLATVTSDPRAAWQRLTPGFQADSEGFGSYSGFWRTVRSASPRNIRADVDALTVSYDVDYRMRNGRQISDSVTLVLERNGSELLIAGES
ncbi:serine/threonine-protein kinase [Nocardioides daphniae]|uniref:non-specific serine/threonine protein kinase n=1 Tax=Nocardioides daphniae TaxID=402297 RepID=A0ABQ1QLM1_9ACTN|nr:serine/threonine-protein kinase [Nocardioides daphniae]GGD30027.1 serine/threonine protein kinase [Nocardioides daphniae]